MTKRVAELGLAASLALAASWLEFMLPPILPNVPGVKLGLANCVILVLLYRRGIRFALLTDAARCVLAGLLFSGLWGLAYSLSGALTSFAAMALLYKSKRFSILGISVCGGAIHNIAQLSVAALTLGTAELTFRAWFSPLLLTG
ncbi:MAG: Gx transporter family protein, partial [Oscillospiraceae bacterium]|nr:Gx transporter family protein [Oscillospiraceae bacterium]